MADPKTEPKPTEKDVNEKPEEDKHVDRDGGERQPSDYSTEK